VRQPHRLKPVLHTSERLRTAPSAQTQDNEFHDFVASNSLGRHEIVTIVPYNTRRKIKARGRVSEEKLQPVKAHILTICKLTS
jgi:hypothetical protein